MSRFVLVDDTNPAIKYDGPWFVSRGSQDNVGNFGPPFQSTLHGVTSDGSLSFSFSGTEVLVLGTSGGPHSASGVSDPSWECFVDGTSIGAKTSLQIVENWWNLCEKDGLSDGQHTITVNAKVTSETFWVDTIQYIPSSNANLDTAMIQVGQTDSVMQYGSGWQDLRDIAKMTSQGGSKMTINFSGVSLTWYGFIPGDYPGGSTSATYSIDGQTPVTFQLKGFTVKQDLYNQVFFQTPQLSAGQHQIEVVYQGNSGVTPLTLDYITIQNAPGASSNPPPVNTASTANTGSSSSIASSGVASATTGSSSKTSSYQSTYPTASVSGLPASYSSGLPASPASSGGTSSGSSGDLSNTGTSHDRQSAPIGAIVGGVVGGIAIILLAALLILCLRRRRKQHPEEGGYLPAPLRHSAFSTEATPRSANNVVEPFIVGPSTHTTYSTYSPSSNSPPANSSGKFAPVRYDSSSQVGRVPQLPPSSGTSFSSRPGNMPDNSSSTADLIPSSKAREAQAERTMIAEGGPHEPSTPPPDMSTGQRVMRHEDSGLRMPLRNNAEMVELPPLYTPG